MPRSRQHATEPPTCHGAADMQSGMCREVRYAQRAVRYVSVRYASVRRGRAGWMGTSARRRAGIGQT